MSAPGPLNLITDVAGLTVGNAWDREARTGATVLLAEPAAVGGVDVRGGAPGTRETDLLRPDCRVDRIDAIAFAGGSAFGLAAADGAVEWLRRQGRGFPVGNVRVPLVPGAIIFDFPIGGRRDWPDGPPYWRLGLEAAANADTAFALGNAGAGVGAVAGGLKGGLGSASAVDGELVVGALAVVNSAGVVDMPGSGTFWAWDLEQAGELGHQRPPPAAAAAPLVGRPVHGGNTTLVVVATNLALDKAGATRLAIMAHAGLARAIRPSHTPADGDTVFALSTGALVAPEDSDAVQHAGQLAADCTARAIARGVFEARTLGDTPCYREMSPNAFGRP